MCCCISVEQQQQINVDDETKTSLQIKPSVSYSDLLFQKSSVKMQWDETCPLRSTVGSIPPDVCFKERFKGPNEDHKNSCISHTLSSPSAFLPSVYYRRKTSATIYPGTTIGDLSYDASESKESGEVSDEEDNSLNETRTITEELEEEERLKSEGPVEYLDNEVFPVLLPCLEKMLFAAKENDVLKFQKSRFDGLDYLAELLWNCNPLHPERHDSHVSIFDIPFVQKHLEENPRPIIPQSFMWTRDQAAIVIQAAIRGYLVRCQPKVQELRQFWKTLAEEK